MGAVNLAYIASRRKLLGLTQKDLAQKIGMKSAPAYNKYEKGTYKFDADYIPLLANALKCDIKEIFLPIELTK